jgi:hypothetical protein
MAGQIPQRLPVLQEAAGALAYEPPDPAIFEAKVEICFATWLLPQVGQITLSIALELRTSSSKGAPHSWHINSKIGIHFSLMQRAWRLLAAIYPTALVFNVIHLNLMQEREKGYKLRIVLLLYCVFSLYHLPVGYGSQPHGLTGTQPTSAPLEGEVRCKAAALSQTLKQSLL